MLALSDITKTYGSRRALDGVSFEVADGRMTGFVGGNGAGKTTTMRIALGVLSKDGGTVTIDGAPVGPDDRRRFGYMPEERGLYPKMKVGEHIAYLARLHGFSRAEANSKAEDLLGLLGLGERLGDNVEALSLGNQQRAQIAAALVHDPELLILDEPFSGLDPLAVDVVAGVLQERARSGVGVLFSSHQLDVVERLCDDLVIIADGSVRATGERDELRDRYAGNSFELVTTGDVGWLRDEPGVDVVDFAGGSAVFDAEPDTAQRVLRRATDTLTIERFGALRPTLAEIFKEVIQ